MIDLKWIYLESRHGKGIPDGICATVKKAIKDLLLFHPDDPLYSVADLFSLNIQDCTTSIELHVYSKADVQKFNSSLPKVGEIKGILKVHEVLYQFREGRLTTYVKDVSVEKAREITLILSIISNVTSNESSESEEDLEGTDCILFNLVLIFKILYSQGFAHLVLMHNFSLTEYIASDEEGAVTNYMTEIKLCQKSFDEDNIGCYYCVYFDQGRYWGLLLKVILRYVLYSSKGTFKSKHEVSGYY